MSLESGKADAATTGQELMVVKAEVLDAVRRYTDDMANKSAELMKEVKESQAEQMTTVSLSPLIDVWSYFVYLRESDELTK